MAQLLFGPQADGFLAELETDPAGASLLAKLNSALDRLEESPGDAWCRRHRYQNIGVWGIAVVNRGDSWLILWEEGRGDSVHVHAITPAP